MDDIIYTVITDGIELKSGVSGQYYLPKIVKEKYDEYTAFLVKPGIIVLMPSVFVERTKQKLEGGEDNDLLA